MCHVPCLTTLLNAVKCLQGLVKRTRHPVDGIVLSKICEVLDTGYVLPYMDCLHEACVTAFFGFLRCGELTPYQDFDPLPTYALVI